MSDESSGIPAEGAVTPFDSDSSVALQTTWLQGMHSLAIKKRGNSREGWEGGIPYPSKSSPGIVLEISKLYLL